MIVAGLGRTGRDLERLEALAMSQDVEGLGALVMCLNWVGLRGTGEAVGCTGGPLGWD